MKTCFCYLTFEIDLNFCFLISNSLGKLLFHKTANNIIRTLAELSTDENCIRYMFHHLCEAKKEKENIKCIDKINSNNKEGFVKSCIDLVFRKLASIFFIL